MLADDGPARESAKDGPVRGPANDGPGIEPANYGPVRGASNDGHVRSPSNDGSVRERANDGPARKPADDSPARGTANDGPARGVAKDITKMSKLRPRSHVDHERSQPNVFMSADLWPEGAYVRWWGNTTQAIPKWQCHCTKRKKFIRIVSYNCRGLPSSTQKLHHMPYVVNIMNEEDVDIICLQETWLSKQELNCLNTFHTDFHGSGVATLDYRVGLRRGHFTGGVAIMWRKCFDSYVAVLNFDTDWLTGIQLSQNNKSYVILCRVYMPYESVDNEDAFVEKLGVIYSIMEDIEVTCFY